MFKKIVVIAMVLVMFAGFAVNAHAECASEDGRPDIVGLEHIEDILKLKESYENDEDVGYKYYIEMINIDGYWMVFLEGEDAYSGYCAFGIYDHAPTEGDFEILWANRMTEDEINNRMEEIGF